MELLADVVRRGAGEHQAFEQRVACQAVGAVQAGVGGLPDGVETGNVGSAGEIHDDPSAGVVRGGNHGDRLAAHVDAHRQAPGEDVGEVGLDEVPGAMGDVEMYVVDAQALDLVVDGARDDVAGSEFAALVEAIHESAAVRQQQFSALAPEPHLGNQERGAHRPWLEDRWDGTG